MLTTRSAFAYLRCHSPMSLTLRLTVLVCFTWIIKKKSHNGIKTHWKRSRGMSTDKKGRKGEETLLLLATWQSIGVWWTAVVFGMDGLIDKAGRRIRWGEKSEEELWWQQTWSSECQCDGDVRPIGAHVTVSHWWKSKGVVRLQYFLGNSAIAIFPRKLRYFLDCKISYDIYIMFY